MKFILITSWTVAKTYYINQFSYKTNVVDFDAYLCNKKWHIIIWTTVLQKVKIRFYCLVKIALVAMNIFMMTARYRNMSQNFYFEQNT